VLGRKVKSYDFPALTGLRFILAAWVVLYHLKPYWDVISVPVFGWFFGYGYLAVDVFFGLSGFVIAHHYGYQLIHGGLKAYESFLWRRLARLYPLHIVTLCGIGILVFIAYQSGASVDPENYTFGLFLENIFLIQAWHWPDTLDWNHPAWAISVEWLLYVLSPFFMRYLYRAKHVRFSIVVIGIIVALNVLIYTIWDYPNHVAYAVWRGMTGYTIGICL
jgi:peptidoglycan/LPS O-acetylase OafA/YrhL